MRIDAIRYEMFHFIELIALLSIGTEYYDLFMIDKIKKLSIFRLGFLGTLQPYNIKFDSSIIKINLCVIPTLLLHQLHMLIR